MRAILGLAGAQTPWNRGRGIARYIAEHAAHLVAAGAVAGVHVDPRLAPPGFLDRLDPGVRRIDGGSPEPPGCIYHVMSPFEELASDRIWPVWARRPDVALVVTLYDLIPLREPDAYLVSGWLRTYYAARLEMIRSADAVLAISPATAEEAVGALGVERSRVHVISTGCSELFTPATPEGDPSVAPRAAVAGLRDGFLLYVGGLDARKNVDRLLAAYAALPRAIRRRAQLVIACPPEPEQLRQLKRRAAALDIESDLLLTGFVNDELLLALYRACRALVMPSLREGFGLPVLEAMRSGGAAVASDIPVLAELVEDRAARFDPASVSELTAVLARLVDDAAFVERLRGAGRRVARRYTWERVAKATVVAYGAARERRLSITRSRKAS